MREMKDSGIEWIGEIPKNKRIIRNKYLLEYTKGKLPTETNFDNEGFPYIGATDLDSNEPYKTYTRDEILPDSCDSDLLVLWDGARAGMCGTHKIGKVSSTIMRIRELNCTIYRPFLYWYYKGFENYMCQRVNGTTIPHMNRKYIEEIQMIDWTVQEQRRIVDYLDRKCSQIDAIIARQQEVIEKLKAYKLSVITEAVTKGLNPDAPMKNSGIEWIGEIPEHWQAPKIKYLATIASGGTPDRSHPEYWNGSINWAKTGELKNSELYETEEKITELALENSSAKVFNIDTILVAMYGQGKTRGMTALLKVPSATNQACAGITVYSKDITVSYLWLFLMGAYDAIREKANGSGQPNLSGALIADFNVTLPPIEEQMNICKTVAMRLPHIDCIIKQKETIVDKLTAYKKSLIYEVVTGKRCNYEPTL